MLGLFSVGRLVLRERIVEFCIVFGTAQFEDAIGIVNLPPGAGTFQPHVTDELIGALNSAAAEGIATSAQFSVADTGLVAFEIPHEFGAGLLAFGGAAFQVVETDEHAGDIIVEQAHLGLLNPFSGLGILAEMNLGKVVEVLGAVEIIEHLSTIRENCLHRIPDPAGSVADETKTNQVLGNEPLFFDVQQIVGKFGLIADLMPAEEVYNLFFIKQIGSDALDLFPTVGNALLLGSNGSHGPIGGKD